MSHVFIQGEGGDYTHAFSDLLRETLGGLFPDNPVRIINASGRQIQRRTPWTDAHVEGSDYTLEGIRDIGITIYNYATFGETRMHSMHLTPRVYGENAVLRGSYANHIPMYDSLRVDTYDGTVGWHVPEASGYEQGGVNTAQGCPVGEYRLREAALFIPLYTLAQAHSRSRGEVTLVPLFEGMMEHILDPEYFADIEARQREEARQAFADLARERHDGALNELEAQIRGNVEMVTDYRRRMTDTERVLVQQRAQIDAILADAEAPRTQDELLEEWEVIMRNVHVTDINMRGRTLIVTTDGLYLPHPTNPDTIEPALLGEYEIALDFGTNTVKVKNLTNAQGRYDHPHVHGGSFCAGSWGGTVEQLLSQRQCAAAVNFLVEVLQTCNHRDDWGRSYRYWFA